MSSSKVAATSKNSTLIVTIDRPAVRNAVIKAAILNGAGSHFCAGAALNEMASGARRKRWHESSDGPIGPTRLSLSKPVIGAIEGYAVAGGFELSPAASPPDKSRAAPHGSYAAWVPMACPSPSGRTENTDGP